MRERERETEREKEAKTQKNRERNDRELQYMHLLEKGRETEKKYRKTTQRLLEYMVLPLNIYPLCFRT